MKEKRKQPVEVKSVSVLDEILSDAPQDRPTYAPLRGDMPVTGRIVDIQDPKEQERFLVRWNIGKTTFEKWLQPLRGLQCNNGDTVMVQYLENRICPVVTGVIGGTESPCEQTTDTIKESQPLMVLSKGSSIQVVAETGRPLLMISNTESGPQLKLLCPDAIIDIPGDLTLAADTINLNAKKGTVKVTSSDDVIVEGKNIYLN